MPTFPWQRRKLSPQSIEKAVLLALRPDAATHIPEKERGPLQELAKAVQAGAAWNRQQGKQVQVQPVAVAEVAARAATSLQASSSATPADIELALRRQGIDWVEPFAPGRPLTPYYGYGRRPRGFNYAVGRNITTDTRPNRLPFATLKQVIEGYDVANICIRHTINDLRSMKLEFGPMDGYAGDVSKDVAEAKAFLKKPDGKNSFTTWLGAFMMDVLRYDAGCLWRERNAAGKVVALKWIDGTTMAPQVDYFGDIPTPPAPAFQQFIQGIPWDWLTTDDIIYSRQWPVSESPYGVAPIETVLVNANTDVRLQWFFLQFFTAGTVPEMFAEAPTDMSDPDSLAELQETWDDWYEGNQAGRHGLRWVPSGSKPTAYKPQTFDPKLAEYVMRRTVAAFGLTPHDLGFTDDVNRATGDTQMDTQFRVTTLPNTEFYQAILDSVLQEDLQLPVAVHFDTGREKEDRLMEAQAHQLYVAMGAESPDEVRDKVLGYITDNDNRVPRFYDNARLGPVPLAYIVGTGGEIDPTTLSPKSGTVKPEDFMAVASAGGAAAPDTSPTSPSEEPPTGHKNPVPGAESHLHEQGPMHDKPKRGSYNTSDNPVKSPGSTRPTNPVHGQNDARKEGGVTSGTGIAGEDLQDDESDEKEDLAKWRSNARKQVARGNAPRRFTDSAICEETCSRVWENLEKATTRDEVDQAFLKAGSPNPKDLALSGTSRTN